MALRNEVYIAGKESAQFPPNMEFNPDAKLWITTFADPLAFHVYTERYVNKGAYHSYRHNSEVTPKYRPVDGDQSFQVPYVLIPSDQLRRVQQKPSDYLTSWLDRGEQTPFFIHPDMMDSYRASGIAAFSDEKIAGDLEAIPTASTRTLMVNMDGVLTMVKVDLSGKVLGRLTRQLSERSGIRSNLISGLMDDAKERGTLPDKLGYFPETTSVGFNTDGKSYANIHREYNPRPRADGKTFIMPFFALYSPDLRNPGSTLIVQQLVEMSGKNPEDYFYDEIAKPFIMNALHMAFREGLLLEAHPQNSLIELDESYGISRFLYRDLQTTIIDTDQRTAQGLSTEFPPEAKKIASWQEGLNYKLDYSSFYDHRIAYQTLEEVIIALAAKFPTPLTVLQRGMQRAFRETVDELSVDPDKYFPKDEYFLYQDGLMQNNRMIPVSHPNPPYR